MMKDEIAEKVSAAEPVEYEEIVHVESFNNFAACTPFESKGLETNVKNGFSTVKQKNSLTKLTVVFPSRVGEAFLHEGDFVWVDSELAVLTQFARVYEVDGKKFVLIPQDRILLKGHPYQRAKYADDDAGPQEMQMKAISKGQLVR